MITIEPIPPDTLPMLLQALALRAWELGLIKTFSELMAAAEIADAESVRH